VELTQCLPPFVVDVMFFIRWAAGKVSYMLRIESNGDKPVLFDRIVWITGEHLGHRSGHTLEVCDVFYLVTDDQLHAFARFHELVIPGTGLTSRPVVDSDTLRDSLSDPVGILRARSRLD